MQETYLFLQQETFGRDRLYEHFKDYRSFSKISGYVEVRHTTPKRRVGVSNPFTDRSLLTTCSRVGPHGYLAGYAGYVKGGLSMLSDLLLS